MVRESLEMEPLTEKLLRRSMEGSFSDNDSDNEDDILVHSANSGPSTEDRQLLDEEDEREKLLTKKRNKILIGGKHGRKKSVESYMEDGNASARGDLRRSKRRRCSAKRILCCHVIVVTGVILGLAIALVVRVFSRPVPVAKTRTGIATLSNGTNVFQPSVLIVSLDGFRPDYIDADLTPNLYKLRETGVAPEYMKPSFPSVTFPNHYTLVTGLYPESHGIVGNTFWDPVLDAEFDIGLAQALESVWWEGTQGGPYVEPIWVTAENQGVRTAIHMWPGSESVIHGVSPTHVDKFKQFEMLSNKVWRVISWLDLPDVQRPSFIAAYVPDIDTIGHHYGPGSAELNRSLTSVDNMIGSLMDDLEARNLTDIINLVVVSDHGMASTSNDRLIYLDSLLDLDTIEHIDCWPLRGLRPKDSENITAMHDHLKSLSENQPWNVYLRDGDMPEKWHYSASYRIAPIYLVPDPEWVIVNSKAEFDPEKDGEYKPKGIHGYDNDDPLMRSLFVGRGPGLRYNYTVKPFDNTEVYGILANLLKVVPNPNNGTFKRGRMQRLPTPKPTPVPSEDGTEDAVDDDIPDMSLEEWEEVEEDFEEEEWYADRPLTWKEYLEIKADEMREEMASWWGWVSRTGGDDSDTAS